MDVVIRRDAFEVGVEAARYVTEAIQGKDQPVIGFATGSSPLGLYDRLRELVEAGELDLRRARGFALDEYVGLPAEHDESYHSVIHRTVVAPLRMDAERVFVPDGAADDVDAAARQYDAAIREAGGIDVQILGIGNNGHIAFNEPFSSFGSRTRSVPLTDDTRAANARFFDSLDDVPTHAVTQGLGTIMESRRAVLVASGAQKADAVAAMLEGPVAVRCPASILQFHPDVHVVLDEAAASKLEHFGR